MRVQKQEMSLHSKQKTLSLASLLALKPIECSFSELNQTSLIRGK